MSEVAKPPASARAILAVAVSLAPSAGKGEPPAACGIYRWLADGGAARFLAVTAIYRLDGEPVHGGTRSFDLSDPGEHAAALEAFAGCRGFVSFDPDRDRALLDPAPDGFVVPSFADKRHWMSLAALARYKALPTTPEGLARAMRVDYPANAVAALCAPPDGLAGDGGRGAAEAVSRMHAQIMLGFHSHGEFPSAYERNIERMTQRMNLDGVGVDLHLVRIMAQARRDLLDRYTAQFRERTGFNPGQRQLLVGWLRTRGFPVSSLDKSAMRNLKRVVAIAAQEGGEATRAAATKVAEVLFLYAECGCSALAKLDMLERQTSNGRICGHLVYYGAHTGRWSSQGVQLQNFPRPGERMAEGVAMLLDAGRARAADRLTAFAHDEVGVAPLAYLQTLLRGVLTDPADLAWCDFAQIEARVLAQCAGEMELLATFIRGNGGNPDHDIYVTMAARVLEILPSEVTRDQRNGVGKPAILGCGFGLSEEGAAGHDHFASVQSDLARKAVREYRAAYPGVVKLWNKLGTIARMAVSGGSATFDMGNGWSVTFSRGNVAPNEQRVRMEIVAGDVVSDMYFPARRTELGWLAGHKLVENMVSRIARDCVAHVMLELEAQGFHPLHVNHDEPIFRAQEGLEEALPAAFRLVEARFGLPEGALWFDYNTAPRYSK